MAALPLSSRQDRLLTRAARYRATTVREWLRKHVLSSWWAGNRHRLFGLGRRVRIGRRMRWLGFRFRIGRMRMHHGYSMALRLFQAHFTFAAVAATEAPLAQMVAARVLGASHANPGG